jgi:RNA polymerase sigma factor (TIGR02999 family)
MPDSPRSVTILLNAMHDGDREAESEFFDRVHGELRRLARQHLRRERRNHSLQPSALVNEAYLRLVDGRERSWNNRLHFMASAAQAMRRILVDYARARGADKRGGAFLTVPLDDILGGTAEPCDDVQTRLAGTRAEILAVDAALTTIMAHDSEQAEMLECRYFSEMSVEDIASYKGVSERTVWRQLDSGKARMLQLIGRRSSYGR